MARLMGIIVAATASLSLWLILWSIDVKAIDAFIIASSIILVAAGVKMATAYLPDRDAIDQ